MTIIANGIYPKVHVVDLPIIKTPEFKKIEQEVLLEARRKGEKGVPKRLKEFKSARAIEFLNEIERRLYCIKIEQQRKKNP